MSKRKLFNTLKRKFTNLFSDPGKREEEVRERMRGELERMARLNGELILMMK